MELSKKISKNHKILYDVIMACLAFFMLMILVIENAMKLSPGLQKAFDNLDLSILIIFAVDYFVRLSLSKSKLKFIKENIIELISIIPFNSLFQTVRVLRIARLLRFMRIFRFSSFAIMLYRKIGKFAKTNNFHYVFLITFTTLIIGSLGISIAENMTFTDALWWSFVTTTTVGYGDISPSTSLGRIIAVILMIIGIGFLGMLTGTISTFFITNKETKSSYKNGIIQDIKLKLDRFDALSQEDINDICKILKTLKE